jgi:SAM-dependent methyltransferase
MTPSSEPQTTTELERLAGGFEDTHAASASVYKQRVIERLLGKDFARPVLDFGCGTGNLTRLLTASFPIVHGYDPSPDSVRLAEARSHGAAFFDDPEALPRDHYGAVVLANVLSHVPPPNRPGLLRIVIDVLEKGGRAIVFEHNPLNPLTRRAFAIAPMEESTELLYPWHVKRLLKRAGLSKVDLDYIVFFPGPLAAARPIEPSLAWLPLGAQVCAWGTKR